MQKLIDQYQADTPAKRAKLYGLALLRDIDNDQMVSRALGIGKDKRGHAQAFRAFYQDYAFVFTNETHQHLHVEIRDFLRQRLLEQRYKQEVYKIIMSIYKNQQQRFHELKQAQTYPDLHTCLNDETWIETFLDLLEAQFWVDPSIGVTYAIPFLLAASLYHPHLIYDIVNICAFFANEIESPQRECWSEVCHSFNLLEQAPQPQDKLNAIKDLKVRMTHGNPFISPLFETYHQQLFAALQWQTGELYRELNMLKEAANHYLEALPALYSEEQIPAYTTRLYRVLADTAPASSLPSKIEFLLKAIEYQPDFEEAYYSLGNIYFDQQKYRLAITYYQYAIELRPYDFEAWTNLGVIHTKLKEYQRALDELNYAEQFDATCAQLYFFRGNIYRELQAYTEALNDFNRAIELDPAYAEAYTNRGNIYAMFNQPERASQDYEQTISLQPDDILALWLREWIQFGKQKVTQTQIEVVAPRLKNIAARDPDHYLTDVCTGIAHGFTQRHIKQALPELERGCRKAPEEWDAYFWLAMVAAYCNHPEQAEAALCDTIERGLPTALLYPLFWLEKDRPDFFRDKVLPLLQKHALYRIIL